MQRRHVTKFATLALIWSLAGSGCTGDGNRYDQQNRDQDADGRSAPEDVETSETSTPADTGGEEVEPVRDTGVSCPEDAGLAPILEPTSEGMYSRRVDGLEIDGTLDRIPESKVSFSAASGGSDNRVTLVTGWSGTRLYLGARIRDSEVDTTGADDPWRVDGLEVAFDPDVSGGASLAGDEVKWILTADGSAHFGTADSGDWSPADGGSIDVASSKTPEGYVLEAAVPASTVSRSFELGSRLSVEVVNNDRDGGDVAHLRWGGGGNELGTPSEWQWLELAGSQCRREEPVRRDAGTDTFDASDAGTTDTDASGCQPESFDRIVVGAGETRRFRLGDGDVFENKLIDITAPNAKYDIVASGNDWTIRNIGVKGYFDGDAKSSPLRVRVLGEDHTGLVEHVYLGDGGGDGRTGLFVLADHAGMLRVRRLNVQHWGDNGVYGSAPGNHENHGNPGEDGIVRIFVSFANDNGSGGFRIGTDGSFCKNCVSINARQFAFWGYYDNTKFINCDAANAASASFAGNARYWIERGTPCGSIEVIDSRHSGSRIFALECEKIGDPAPNPRTSPPKGVPTTPREAASGCASAVN